ncbi:MAG: alpha-L-fucosidase [Oscillospiraceae bacterium]|jgi:alpha-L-fucosidase|nr:alpha-L-fucosidase [Oscillospiraceae bacterium]
MFDWDAYHKRVDWFVKARFGMFIHWGLYSIPARGEWVRSVEKIPVEDYEPFFKEFNPVDYDPKAWAKLAKKAGMKYAVLTSKHHDGFCLFDSKLTDYKATNTPAGRDLVREYLEAFRAEGIKVGLYYSLIDWHHPDYPHYGDRIHPMRDNEAFKDHKYNFDNYLTYLHGQVRELLTGYGKLDIMWFDFSYGEMSGEKWRATELTNMIRSLQPHILIDNRMEVSGEGFGSLLSGDPNVYSGDFVSPEQIIPPEGIFDQNGRRAVWEACATLNNNWGYHATDSNWKPAPMVVRKLAECVSKGGNFLLNVGPDARGNIPPDSVKILSEVGEWMSLNGESIYNCGYADLPKPDFGRYTRNGNKVYAHIFDNALGLLPLLGLDKGEIVKARALATGAELSLAGDWTSNNYKNAFVKLGPSPVLPDETDTVVEITVR